MSPISLLKLKTNNLSNMPKISIPLIFLDINMHNTLIRWSTSDTITRIIISLLIQMSKKAPDILVDCSFHWLLSSQNYSKLKTIFTMHWTCLFLKSRIQLHSLFPKIVKDAHSILCFLQILTQEIWWLQSE